MPPTTPVQPAYSTPPVEVESEKPLWRRALSFALSWIIIPLLLVLIVHNFVFQAWYVEGESMQPTFQNGDYLIVSKLSTSWHRLTGSSDKLNLERGEVVIFQPPNIKADIFYIKRVIGLPGDRVAIRNGYITIYNQENPEGFVLTESYIDNIPLEGDLETTISPGEVFVVGDNRNHDASQDSRALGPIPMENVVGTATLRLMPASQFGLLTKPDYTATTPTPALEVSIPE